MLHSATLPPVEKSSLGLHVLFFGPARIALQRDRLDLPWRADGTVDEFWALLEARYPAIISMRKNIRLARNGEFLGTGEMLQPGNEIALIPPVSGG